MTPGKIAHPRPVTAAALSVHTLSGSGLVARLPDWDAFSTVPWTAAPAGITKSAPAMTGAMTMASTASLAFEVWLLTLLFSRI